ncbi:hypothetical protein KR054_005203, partial [Drosophila jambulina]
CSMIVQAYKLRKWQWRKPPVRNFTMNMYDDQITVLLGPSNAGKSTVLNMLSRSYSPDSGWVKIDNNDIRSNLRRSILGLAPQHNALYANMTVCQHISFYTSLRRSAWRLRFKKRRHQSMEKYLRCLDLWCVRHVKACSLSRADKKKLAIACAFCGSPRIVLLDQPTEGLEPCERRLVWDLLRSEKRCRTIIITTYHIEEADALADRVGILCDGLLVFNGSAVFLKNCYGSGYQLVLSQGVLYQEPRIAALVAKYAPDTIIASDKDCEMQYNIPQCNCQGIVPLLTCLERPVQCLNINTMQIGTTPIIEKYVNASAPICDFSAYMSECVECDILCALLLCLSIFTGFFMSFVIRERVLGFKLMQKVQGINMATFWLAHLLWDWLFLTLFATILLLIMSVIFKTGFDD